MSVFAAIVLVAAVATLILIAWVTLAKDPRDRIAAPSVPVQAQAPVKDSPELAYFTGIALFSRDGDLLATLLPVDDFSFRGKVGRKGRIYRVRGYVDGVARQEETEDDTARRFDFNSREVYPGCEVDIWYPTCLYTQQSAIARAVYGAACIDANGSPVEAES